jgi:hypothetical protein
MRSSPSLLDESARDDLDFDVKDTTGKVKHHRRGGWSGDQYPADWLTKTSLAPGVEVTLRVYMSKNGNPAGRLNKIVLRMEPNCTDTQLGGDAAARPLTIPPANSGQHIQEDIVRTPSRHRSLAALASMVMGAGRFPAQGGQGTAKEPPSSQGGREDAGTPGPAPKRDLSGTWVGPRAGAPADNAEAPTRCRNDPGGDGSLK